MLFIIFVEFKFVKIFSNITFIYDIIFYSAIYTRTKNGVISQQQKLYFYFYFRYCGNETLFYGIVYAYMRIFMTNLIAFIFLIISIKKNYIITVN